MAVSHPSPSGYLERPRPSGLADVIDIIHDKGLVIDAYKGHPDIDVDHQALVQDGVDDIGETAWCGAIKVSVAGSALCDGHEI